MWVNGLQYVPLHPSDVELIVEALAFLESHSPIPEQTEASIMLQGRLEEYFEDESGD